MNIENWEFCVASCINALNLGEPVNNLDNFTETDVCKKLVEHIAKSNNIQNDVSLPNIVKLLFPSYNVDIAEKFDQVCVACLLLVHISFTSKEDFEVFKTSMCNTTNNSTQILISQFFMNLMKYKRVSDIPHNVFKNEVLKMMDSCPGSKGDCVQEQLTSPRNINWDSDTSQYDSPLQEFFQTPKRKSVKRDNIRHIMYSSGEDSERIKKLQNELLEEESRKSILQEELELQKKLCHELERKLSQKLTEIDELKESWERDGREKEEKFQQLNIYLKKKEYQEKKLKSELSTSETYVGKLEKDVSVVTDARDAYKEKLEQSLFRVAECDKEIEEANKVNKEMYAKLLAHEFEIHSLKENNVYLSSLLQSYETSSGNNSTFNISKTEPETMDAVVEQMLREERELNAELKIQIEELTAKLSDFAAKNTSLQSWNVELEGKVEELKTMSCQLEQTKEELSKISDYVELLANERDALEVVIEDKVKLIENFVGDNETLRSKLSDCEQEYRQNELKLNVEVNNLQQQVEMKVVEVGNHVGEIKKLEEVNKHNQEQIQHLDLNLFETVRKLENIVEQVNTNSCDDEVDRLKHLLDSVEEQFNKKVKIEVECVELSQVVRSLQEEIANMKGKEVETIQTQKELENCVKTGEDKILSLEVVLSDCTSKLDQLNEVYVEKCKELDKVEDNLTTTQKLLFDVKKEKKQLEEELKLVNNELLQTKTCVNNEEKRNQRFEESLKMKVEEITSLQVYIDHSNLANAKLSKKLVQCEEALHIAQNNIKQLITKHAEDVTNFERVVEMKEKEIEVLKHQISQIEANNSDLGSMLQILKTERQELLNKVEVYKKERQQQDVELKQISEECDNLQKEVDRLSGEKEMLTKKLQEAVEEQERLRVEHRSMEHEFVRQLTSEQQSAEILRNNLDNMKAESSGLEKERDEAVEKLKIAEEKVREMCLEQDQLVADHSVLESEVTVKIKQVEDLGKKLLEVKSKCVEIIGLGLTDVSFDDLLLKLREFEQHHNQVVKDREELSDSLEKQEELLKQKEEEMNKMKNDCAKLEEERIKLYEEILSMKTTISELEDKQKELLKGSDSSSAEAARLSRELEDVYRRYRTVKKELHDAQLSVKQTMEGQNKMKEESEKFKTYVGEKISHLTTMKEEMSEQLRAATCELDEKRKSVESLKTEISRIGEEKIKTQELWQDLKQNVVDMKKLLSQLSTDEAGDAKSILSKISSESLVCKNSNSDYCSINVSSNHSFSDVELDSFEKEFKNLFEDVLEAKHNLHKFLVSSVKQFEELDKNDTMTQRYKELETQLSLVEDNNKRLENNMRKVEKVLTHKDDEMRSLTTELTTLNTASLLLKEKVNNLERVNSNLSVKSEECMLELNALRERNKTLNSELQGRIMLQLRQQDTCWSLVKSKQTTDSLFESTINCLCNIDKRLTQLRSSQTSSTLSELLRMCEHKQYIVTHKLVNLAVTCLKWSEKNVQQSAFILAGDRRPELDDNVFHRERMLIEEQLDIINQQMKLLSQEIDAIESKLADSLSDSLEEVPVAVVNKTFDLIDLEKLSDEQMSVKSSASATAWVVSPPKKQTVQPPPLTRTQANKGTAWSVEFKAPQTKKVLKKKPSTNPSRYHSANDLTKLKEPRPVTRSSSYQTLPTQDAPFYLFANRPVDCVVKKEHSISDDDYSSEKTQLQSKVLSLNRSLNMEKNKVESLTNEREELKKKLHHSESERRNVVEKYEREVKLMRQNIAAKYEAQLEHLKAKMKALHNQEVRKLNEFIDELRNQNWELGEKLLTVQKEKNDIIFSTARGSVSSFNEIATVDGSYYQKKDFWNERKEDSQMLARRMTTSARPTFPPEDEEGEVFDNRFLEDMKAGICKTDRSEGRLTELQYRNSMCLPHLKSSYPAETQFHNPKLFKEEDLRLGTLLFSQESHSLTDSDNSMTRSLLPDDKTKKKEQTSYKRPGPPTPSKNGGRLSLQSNELKLTPRNVLKELNDGKSGTPSRLRSLFTKHNKRNSLGSNSNNNQRDENSNPGTPKGKRLKIFGHRKPFGGRDF